jgi:hypothetical protein
LTRRGEHQDTNVSTVIYTYACACAIQCICVCVCVSADNAYLGNAFPLGHHLGRAEWQVLVA